jgi:hypothetical protein
MEGARAQTRARKQAAPRADGQITAGGTLALTVWCMFYADTRLPPGGPAGPGTFSGAGKDGAANVGAAWLECSPECRRLGKRAPGGLQPASGLAWLGHRLHIGLIECSGFRG